MSKDIDHYFKNCIENKYLKSCLPNSVHLYKVEDGNAQDPHQA